MTPDLEPLDPVHSDPDHIFYAEPDLDSLAKAMADILHSLPFAAPATLCPALDAVLRAQGGSVEAVCSVVDALIDDAVDSGKNRPRVPTLSAQKYAELCWAVEDYLDAASSGKIQWLWAPEALQELRAVDFYKLLWQRLRLTFNALQSGGDGAAFVNAVVLTAECFKQRLLDCTQCAELCDRMLCRRNIHRFGRNDVEALHQMFRRCGGALRRSPRRRDFAHFLELIDAEMDSQRLGAADGRYPTVRWMVGQMHRHFAG